MFLINPTTLEYHRIPTFHLAVPQQSSCSAYGLGYDLGSDDYKVVTLSRYREGHIDTTFVDVYSVRMGLWRRLESLPYDDVLSELGGPSGVLVNGALHWMAGLKLSWRVLSLLCLARELRATIFLDAIF